MPLCIITCIIWTHDYCSCRRLIRRRLGLSTVTAMPLKRDQSCATPRATSLARPAKTGFYTFGEKKKYNCMMQGIILKGLVYDNHERCTLVTRRHATLSKVKRCEEICTDRAERSDNTVWKGCHAPLAEMNPSALPISPPSQRKEPRC